MNRKLFFFGSILWFINLPAYAVCPLCICAVSVGVGLSRYLGVDDVISGIWLGAGIMALTFWLQQLLIKFLPLRRTLSWFLALILGIGGCLLPLCRCPLVGHILNRLWGIDKLILGCLCGGSFFSLSNLWYQRIKRRNSGHAQFPFQKVILPCSVLLLVSLVFALVIL